MMEASTQDSNNQRVTNSESDTDILLKSAELNRLEVRSLAGLADSLGEHLQECQEHGNELRDEVISLREKVDGTQKRIANRIAPSK
jgi:peptidoglycan hydrolase CwlO-like protein